MSSDEYYPMPSFPMLAVRDLALSTRWYQDTLGFKLVFAMPGAGGKTILAHLRWLKYADLLLVQEKGELLDPKGVGVTLAFALFDGDIDEFAEGAKAKGANIISGPVTQAWNAREVTILDPDGFRLVFTQRADAGKTMEQVIEAVKTHSQ